MEKSKLHESILNNSQMTFARSGGNGGQNVNKVNTKCVRPLAAGVLLESVKKIAKAIFSSSNFLVLPVTAIGGISDEERGRLRVKLSSILNKDDCLFLDVDDERYQERNREIALARLENRIVQALFIPKKRKPTKPTKASKERKLKLKKIRSEVKKNRQKVW